MKEPGASCFYCGAARSCEHREVAPVNPMLAKPHPPFPGGYAKGPYDARFINKYRR